jgi:hypothetical protein
MVGLKLPVPADVTVGDGTAVSVTEKAVVVADTLADGVTWELE